MLVVLFDLNGTLAVDGSVPPKVKEKLALLKEKGVAVYLLSSDTFGTLERIAEELGVVAVKVDKGYYGSEKKAKLAILLEFKKNFPDATVVAVGNGSNDELILKAADLGICVIGKEGAATATLLASDIVVTDPIDAIELLAKKKRLKATTRA